MGNFVHRLCRRLCRNSMQKIGRFLCPKFRHSLSVLAACMKKATGTYIFSVQAFGQRVQYIVHNYLAKCIFLLLAARLCTIFCAGKSCTESVHNLSQRASYAKIKGTLMASEKIPPNGLISITTRHRTVWENISTEQNQVEIQKRIRLHRRTQLTIFNVVNIMPQ